MKNILKNLKFIFMPHFWLMQNEYSKRWDLELNQLMDEKSSIIGYYNHLDNSYLTAKIGGSTIWIGNYPYSYGIGSMFQQPEVRPSRQTILRLKNYINKNMDKSKIW